MLDGPVGEQPQGGVGGDEVLQAAAGVGGSRALGVEVRGGGELQGKRRRRHRRRRIEGQQAHAWGDDTLVRSPSCLIKCYANTSHS